MTVCATRNAWLAAVSLLAAIPLTSLQAQDQDAANDPVDQAIIAPGEGSGHTGRLAVNVAAGANNQQISSAVLAQGNIALGSETVIQTAITGEGDRATSITIAGDAFSGNSGLVSLNISAGSQNQSANLAMLTIGQSGAISDQLLEQSRAPSGPSRGAETTSAARNDAVEISDDAFGNSSGLFQANLIGGERNSSANTFSLSISAGGQP